MAFLPNDPLFQDQWYLFNTGNNSPKGIAGIDINLIDNDPNTFDVWDNYTGKGITVGIIDSGIESTHEDLNDNYNARPNLTPPYDPVEGQPDEKLNGFHGTSVAGIIAAEKNGIGVVGIAYDAKITGFRYDDRPNSISRQVAFDISNNSWGSRAFFVRLPQDEQQGLRDAITNGRQGLGTVFVFSGGNYRASVNVNFVPDPNDPDSPVNSYFQSNPDLAHKGNNVNYNNYKNSRHVIAVAAIQSDGTFARYSSPGAALLVSAFGDSPASIVSTDRTGNDGYNNPSTKSNRPQLENPDYTNQFNGTSSAAPMVSGVVALMLQANPNLGYRDVQEILAYSTWQNDPNARRYDPTVFNRNKRNSDEWTFNGATNWNGGGLHINHDYGYGLLDAHAAVRLAETWQLQSTAANASVGTTELEVVRGSSLPTGGQAIPDNDSRGIEATFTVKSGLQLDHVELSLDIEHGQFQDLVITLTSPDGTESVLLDRVPYTTQEDDTESPVSAGPVTDERGFRLDELKYTFSSTRYWGEIGEGTWTLKVSDNSDAFEPTNTGEPNTGTAGNTIGKLNSATLRLYGDRITDNNTYIYTEEFSKFTHDFTRKILSDPNNLGSDTINAATIRSDSVIDLNPGSSSSLAGNFLTIDSNTTIENAFGGDGNDYIIGNCYNNWLQGNRGNDILEAGGGADILDGGFGDDSYILALTDSGSTIQDNGGIDTLIFSNLTLTLTNPTAGHTGFARRDDTLFIDLNQDGIINQTHDLSILQFFGGSNNTAGSGFIENVGNLRGTDILSATNFDRVA